MKTAFRIVALVIGLFHGIGVGRATQIEQMIETGDVIVSIKVETKKCGGRPCPVANDRIRSQDALEFLHNGSSMSVDPALGEIRYARPKESIAETVGPGDLLFKGEPWDQLDQYAQITGTAYIFKKGCPRAPYEVSGGFSRDRSRIVLRGAVPVREKGGCNIVGYSSTNSNALLVFEAADYGFLPGNTAHLE